MRLFSLAGERERGGWGGGGGVGRGGGNKIGQAGVNAGELN